MKKCVKTKLYIITLIIDLILICIFLLQKLQIVDLLWFISVLIVHFAFYYGLKNDKRNLLDILHYFVFILPVLSLFLKNIYFKSIALFFILLIQFLWIREKTCILNEENVDFGYGDLINYCVIILTILLSIDIGYTYAKSKFSIHYKNKSAQLIICNLDDFFFTFLC